VISVVEIAGLLKAPVYLLGGEDFITVTAEGALSLWVQGSALRMQF
jgi:hypothetical protein